MSDTLNETGALRCLGCGGSIPYLKGAQAGVTVECPVCHRMAKYSYKDLQRILLLEKEAKERDKIKHYEL